MAAGQSGWRGRLRSRGRVHHRPPSNQRSKSRDPDDREPDQPSGLGAKRGSGQRATPGRSLTSTAVAEPRGTRACRGSSLGGSTRLGRLPFRGSGRSQSRLSARSRRAGWGRSGLPARGTRRRWCRADRPSPHDGFLGGQFHFAHVNAAVWHPASSRWRERRGWCYSQPSSNSWRSSVGSAADYADALWMLVAAILIAVTKASFAASVALLLIGGAIGFTLDLARDWYTHPHRRQRFEGSSRLRLFMAAPLRRDRRCGGWPMLETRFARRPGTTAGTRARREGRGRSMIRVSVTRRKAYSTLGTTFASTHPGVSRRTSRRL